jgi:hypothetical protein
MSMEIVAHEGPLEFLGGMFFLGRWANDGPWVIQQRDNVGAGRSSHTYKSEEEARGVWRELIDGVKCRECGAGLEWDRGCVNWQELQDRQLCHGCDFWTERIAKHDEENGVVIDGYRYSIGPDKPANYRGFVGHGGSPFTIRFNDDGLVVTTRNLWANGRIPDHFVGRYPNTAVFMKVSNDSAYVGSGTAAGATTAP